MEKLRRWGKKLLDLIGGDAAWDAIRWLWEHKPWRWAVGVAMILVTTATGILGKIAELPGYQQFLCLLIALAISLICAASSVRLAINIREWRRRRESEKRGVPADEALHRSIEYLRQTLQPHLEAEPLVLQLEPYPRSRGRRGSFALLCVTNEPKSLSRHAVAVQVHAKVSYCDDLGNEILRPIRDAWFLLERWYTGMGYVPKPGIISSAEQTTGNLPPHESIHLGIAVRYPWGEEIHAHALSPLSSEHPEWLDPELLFRVASFYVKVFLTCDGFQTTYHYVLKDCGPEKGLQLQSIPDPTSQPSGTS